MSEELKVVITQRNGKTVVGVQSSDCDPVVTVISGALEEALPRVPNLVIVARAQWQQNPRYPKSERVVPKAPVRTPEPSRQATAKPSPKKTEPQPQSKLF